MTELKISIAKEVDIPGINQVIQNHRDKGSKYYQPIKIEDAIDVVQNDKKTVFVAKRKNEIVGYLDFYCQTSSFLDSRNEAEIIILVDPGFLCRGIGGKLLKNAMQYAINKTRLKQLKAGIKKGNEGSERLLKKNGFNLDHENSIGFTMTFTLDRDSSYSDQTENIMR